jgi:membrane-bound lytic murein transglycosylase A
MIAQDTGGAIRGAIRADFFWGYGEAAAAEAGRMKQKLRMWVLLPQGYTPSNPVSAE